MPDSGEVKQRLQRTFARQFARPSGPLGRLVARLMRRSNASLNLWMVDLLEVGSEDRILEVGFGPGVALAVLLARAQQGLVAGVDASASMANQARRRHRQAIREGRLQIHEGDASSLPYDDNTFDKVCGTHVLYFWADPVTTLRELHRVLRPAGFLALAYQERAHMPLRAAQGLPLAGARLVGPGEVEDLVRGAGFNAVRLETKPGPTHPSGFCVIAAK